MPDRIEIWAPEFAVRVTSKEEAAAWEARADEIERGEDSIKIRVHRPIDWDAIKRIPPADVRMLTLREDLAVKRNDE